MSCQVNRNPKTNEIEKVLAPNGKESILYQSIEKLAEDKEEALRMYARVYTPDFKAKYGNWESGEGKSLDQNGEPLLTEQLKKEFNQKEDSASNQMIAKIHEDMAFDPNTTFTLIGAMGILTEVNETSKYNGIRAKMVPVAVNDSLKFKVELVTDKSRVIELKRETDKKADKDTINKFMDTMLKRFPGITYQWIKPSDLIQSEHPYDVKNINSYVKNGVVYLVEGRVTQDIALEETLHPFVEALTQDAPSIAKGLVLEGEKQFPEISARLKRVYKNSTRDYELEMANAILKEAYKMELDKRPQGEQKQVRHLLARFREWLAKILSSLFNVDLNNYTVSANKLSKNLTLSELAKIVADERATIEIAKTDIPAYNLSEGDDESTEIGVSDEYFSSRERNIQRIQGHIDMLDVQIARAMDRDEQGKVDVLNKIQQSMESALEDLKAGKDTVSVSRLVGGGSLDIFLDNQKYQNFGNFLHGIIEELQISNLGDDRQLPSKQVTEDFINKMLEKEQAKPEGQRFTAESGESSDITDLGKKHLVQMVRDIMRNYDQYIMSGYTVLPELTVIGKDKYGRSVIGRIDTLAISKSGAVEIIDLKTKKLYNQSEWSKINAQLSTRRDVQPSTQSASEFFTVPDNAKRSAYENWDIQLGVYESIFNQMGIPVAAKKILALLYMGEGNMINLPDSMTSAYDFKYSDFTIFIHDSNEAAYGNASQVTRFKHFQNIIKDVMGIKEANKKNTQAQKVMFTVASEQEKDLIEKLTSILKGEIDKTRKEKDKYKKEMGEDSEIYKSLNDRYESLRKVQDTIEKGANMDAALKLSNILTFLDETYETMINVIDDIKKETDVNKKAQVLDAMRRRANGLNGFVNQMKNVLIGSDNLKQNEEALKTIGRIETNIQAIMIAYNEVGADFMIKVIADMDGARRQSTLTKEREAAIKPRLEYLRKRVQELKNGSMGVGTAISKAKFWAVGNMKNAVRSFFNVPGQTMSQIEALEYQIKQLELELEGVKMNEADIRKFVEGVLTNEKSLLYMGQNVTVVSNVIAAASNRDLGISGFSNFLKQAPLAARRQTQDFLERVKFQDRLDKFAAGRKDMTELSKLITEVRKVREMNADGKMEDVEYLSFIDPVSAAYRNVFHDFRENLFKINEQIREADKIGKEDERKRLVKERQKLVDDHRKWKLANSVMPLVAEVYELEDKLPAEYREKRAELLEEINTIRHKVGYNNEEDMTEEDALRIGELETELQRLKVEYLKDNKEYDEYIDKLNQFYTYETNWNFFNRLKNSKMIQYGEESDEFAKWMEENTIKVPTQEYYDRIGEIFEEMFSIMESNPDIQDLRERQREIMRKVRRRGYADVRFLTTGEREEYQELEDLIASLMQDSTKPEYGTEDSNRLRELRNELNSMRVRVTNPFYNKQFTLMKQEVDQLYYALKDKEKELADDPNNADLKRAYELAYNSFVHVEEKFEKWYNENHLDQYESALFREQPLNPKPRGFNLIFAPLDSKHYEVKPNNKYMLRKLRTKEDGSGKVAANPAYQEDVYGYPLPKGLKHEDGVMKVVSNNANINSAYVALSNRKEEFEFYNFLVGEYHKAQKDVYGRSLGYLVPGYEKESLQVYQDKGVMEGVKENFRLWKENNFTVDSPNSYNFNGFTSDIDRVRFKHNTPLPIEKQSGNAIGAVIKWFTEANINKAVGEIQPLANAAISYMEGLRKQLDDANVPDKELRKKELDNVIGVLKNEYSKIIKGETKNDQGRIARILDTSLRGMSLTRMGLDLPNQFGNLLSGNMQIFLGGHKTGQYNNKNLLWAKRKVYGSGGLMNSLVKDLHKISGKTFMTKMYIYWNPTQHLHSDMFDKSLSGADRAKQSLLDLEFTMWMQEKGEIEIASTIWLAMMDNRMCKYTDPNTKEEKMVNVWEAYGENADGEVVIKPGYDWTTKDEAELMRNMYSEIRRTQGNYAELDKTKAEMNILGRMGMFFRKYLGPTILNRFGSLREDHEASQVAMGYWNALFKAIGYYGAGKTFMSIFKKNEVSDFYRQRIQWAAREAVVAVVLYLLGNLLKDYAKSLGDDDDDKISDTVMLNMLAVFIKLDRETRSMVPLPVFGGIDNYATELTSFTNAGSDYKTISNIMKHGLTLGMAQIPGFDTDWVMQSAYYQKDYGIWEKGDTKLKKDIYDALGVLNVLNMINPETRVTESFRRR